ncbi:hypothetical protein D1007_01153 [Hordeum vulgare]|nr:hypothetical protein D1007_01153 [Hordeum vulgare]
MVQKADYTQWRLFATKVQELLDPYTGNWDIELVHDLFWAVDVSLILAIPVKTDIEDDWAWSCDPKGIFSVKSAYKLQRLIGQREQAGLDMDNERQMLLACVGPKDFLNRLLKWEKKQAMTCIALLWTWWTTRNKINAENMKLNISAVQFQTRRMINDFETFCLKTPRERLVQMQRWKPPTDDTLKINTDGILLLNERAGGWGFVIRDKAGEAVGSGAGKLNYLQDSLQAEAEACLEHG